MKFFLLALLVFFQAPFTFAKITEVITTEAPVPAGHYSQAVRAGDYLFISGHVALDPTTSKLVGTTIEEQTTQVLNNLEAILHSQALTFANVVKAEVYLKDIRDFDGMNSVYSARMTQPVKPARQTMQVANLPLQALVEISCIAFIPKMGD